MEINHQNERKMKTKIWSVFLFVVLLRLVMIFSLKEDPAFYLSPRNFNGRGLVAAPHWLDFIMVMTVIIALYQPSKPVKFHFKNWIRTLAGFLLIIIPVVSGMLLIRYRSQWHPVWDFNGMLILRWVLFVLSFIAIQFFTDKIHIRNKWLRGTVLFLFVFFLAVLQDFVPTTAPDFKLFTFLNSVGLSTAFVAFALRPFYKRYPGETLLTVTLLGFLITLPAVNVRSQSYFTFFLPVLAWLLVAYALHCRCRKIWKYSLTALPVAIALFLQSGLPRMVSPAVGSAMTENVKDQLITEKAGTVTIRYASPAMREFALNLARVLEAANEISRKELGVSPGVKELILTGFGPGGFHAEFPGKIVGNIISREYMKACLDSTFLNNPELSPHFPDPVNGILHEYSHLFGAVPYHRWMPGPEEEGWATFSAVQLSKILHQYYGDSLWNPPYDYARQAQKIDSLNLAGKAVIWSHAYEFGGYQLWHRLSRQMNLRELYQKRWQHTERNLLGIVLLESFPKKARQLAEAFGTENLKKSIKPVRYGDLYSLQDFLMLGRFMNMDSSTLKKFYDRMKNRMVNPSVKLP